MGKRKRHHKATNSLETLAEKKLPQGTTRELQAELTALQSARKEAKRLRTRRKVPKRKQVVEGVVSAGFRADRDKSLAEGAELAEPRAAKRVKKLSKVSVKPLLRAAAGGDLPQLKALLVEPLSANSADAATGLSPLMAAAAKGQVKALHWLLRHGAVAETRDPNGDTALSFAARAGHLRAVEVLLERLPKTAARKQNDLQRAVSLALEQPEVLKRLLAVPGVKERAAPLLGAVTAS